MDREMLAELADVTWMDTAEFANLLGLNVELVRERIRAGDLTAFKMPGSRAYRIPFEIAMRECLQPAEKRPAKTLRTAAAKVKKNDVDDLEALFAA